MTRGLRPKISEKHWAPSLELEIQRVWEEEDLYRFDPNSEKPKFSIDTPPPYASGKWHAAAVIHYAQIDMIARTMRMRGYEVYFPWGVDRNGLPVEVETEKKYGIKMSEYPREEFLGLCRKFLDEAEKDILGIGRRLGISADFRNYFQTDSEMWRTQTQATFIEAWRRGLVYEDYRPNNYCPRCGTTLADAEIEYRDMETLLVYLRFREDESGREVLVATTRPELLPACAAVIFNPEDERHAWLRGRRVRTPLGRVIPVAEHPYADPEFGTGLVMVCSYGDKADVRLFRELKLEPTILIDENGKMTEAAGKYAGMTVEEARKVIIRDLEEMGAVARIERLVHRTPVCWRCKTPIEIVPMREYYLRQVDFKDAIREAVEEQVRFHPNWAIRYLLDWIDSIETDWPISRRRYYATEIPVWYCKSCGKPVLPEPGKYYRPWRDDPPVDRCPHCGSAEGFVGETRVFDTWMDSSISPLVYNGFGWNEKLYSALGTSDIRPQGKDIVRTWLFYTLLRVWHALGKPAFRHIWISGLGLDERGRAMHKSLGNVVYPWPIFEKYGADALRMFGAAEAHHGSDYRISGARIEGAFKFLQKLWNVARFVSSFPMPDERPELRPTDLWILGELNGAVERALRGYEDFDFFPPAREIRHFVWEVFAPHYVELVKSRAYGDVEGEGQRAAWWTLHTVLRGVLRLAAPIVPHITDVIWRSIYGREKSVHLQSLPTPNPDWDTEYLRLGQRLMKFNSEVWKFKKERGISLKTEIEYPIPGELEPFRADLVALHRIRGS